MRALCIIKMKLTSFDHIIRRGPLQRLWTEGKTDGAAISLLKTHLFALVFMIVMHIKKLYDNDDMLII